MGARFADRTALSIPDTLVRNMYIANFEAIRVAMVGTQLFGVRLAALAMTIPMFGLVYCVASIDGLAQRAIRRASGGRESASLYHRAKHLQVVILAVSGTASLLPPVSIDAQWAWVATAIGLPILVRVQWVFYKKHLCCRGIRRVSASMAETKVPRTFVFRGLLLAWARRRLLPN